jgi:hypothetical protein
VEALLAAEQLPGVIWECACGPRAIVRVLRRAGHKVYATDLVDYGCEDADAPTPRERALRTITCSGTRRASSSRRPNDSDLATRELARIIDAVIVVVPRGSRREHDLARLEQ